MGFELIGFRQALGHGYVSELVGPDPRPVDRTAPPFDQRSKGEGSLDHRPGGQAGLVECVNETEVDLPLVADARTGERPRTRFKDHRPPPPGGQAQSGRNAVQATTDNHCLRHAAQHRRENSRMGPGFNRPRSHPGLPRGDSQSSSDHAAPRQTRAFTVTFGFVEDVPGRVVGLVERFFERFRPGSCLSDSSFGDRDRSIAACRWRSAYTDDMMISYEPPDFRICS